MKRAPFLLSLLLLAAPAAGRDFLQLTDGTILVGDVIAITDEHVDIAVDYPEPDERRVALAELTDRTLWRIRSDRLKKGEEQAWFDLGRWAEERGLMVPALVSYRRASANPELAKKAEPRIAAVETTLAQDLFDGGERHYVNGRPAAARTYFALLVSRYPSSPAATMARQRLERIGEELAARKEREDAARAQARADEQLRTEFRRWNEDVARVRALLREAALQRPARMRLTQPVRTSRALEGAVATLEQAWRTARRLGAPPEGVPEDAGRDLREAVRSRLVDAYVDTAYAYLMRPSVSQAEEYAVKATELDPESREARELYRRIIESRLTSDFGDGFLHRRLVGRRGLHER